MQPEALTPAFFTDLLGLPVVEVERERIGTGLVGMNVRCTLTYASSVDATDGTEVPRSLVAKLPSPDETSRATGVALRNYEREVKFYLQVASTVAVRTPRCWDAVWEETSGEFHLILEDLAPGEQGDQIAGCSPAQARASLHELARLHAPRWADPTLDDLDWLSRRTGPDDLVQLQGFYQMCFPTFAATYGPHLDAAQFELAEEFGARVADWAGLLEPPYTVTHGDYRLENLMFAGPGERYEVAAVDWQTPGHGAAAADLSYFLGAGLAVPLRRAHERALVEEYHRELVGGGVVGYDLDTCWTDYRRSAFAGVIMSVVASTIVGRTDRSEAMFTAMATRHLQHALDLDAWAMLG